MEPKEATTDVVETAEGDKDVGIGEVQVPTSGEGQQKLDKEGASENIIGEHEKGEHLEGEHAGGEPAEGEPAEGKPAEGEPAEGKPAEGEPAEGEPAERKPAEGEPAEGKPAEGEPAEGRHVEGEHVDGEHVEGEHVEGEKVEKEHVEGELVEGDQKESIESEHAEGEEMLGEHVGGEQVASEQLTSEYTEGEQTEGEQTEGEQTEGEQTEGEQTEGEQTEGEQSEGEQTEGEQSEGEEGTEEEEGTGETPYTDLVEEEEEYVEEPPPDPAAPYNFSDSQELLKDPFELRPDQVAEVEQLWDFYQNYNPAYTDLNGYITEKELIYMLKCLLLMTYTPEQLQELITFCVRPPHPQGHITYEQFLRMVTVRQRDFPAEDELRSALLVLDPQKSGAIDREYLRDVLSKLGNKLTPKLLDRLIKEVDISNDGTIGIEDVVGTMCIDLNREDIIALREKLFPEERKPTDFDI